MKLIIGLGNPGKQYAKNRHNVGEMVVKWLKEEEKRRGEEDRGVRSASRRIRGEEEGRGGWKLETLSTFMNDSGKAVADLTTNYQLPTTDLIIIHDDLDLKLGTYKLQKGKGPVGHKGILSIEDELGTKDFWRLRIGIDSRDTENRTPGVEYTLQDFTPEEFKVLQEVFSRIQKELETRNW